MIFLGVVSLLLAVFATLGCWLEWEREKGWRYVWAPLLLGVLSVIGAGAAVLTGADNLAPALSYFFFAMCFVAMGALVGVVLRKKASQRVVVARMGLWVFGLMFCFLFVGSLLHNS